MEQHEQVGVGCSLIRGHGIAMHCKSLTPNGPLLLSPLGPFAVARALVGRISRHLSPLHSTSGLNINTLP